MRGDARELIEHGNALFAKRMPLLDFWQRVSEVFTPSYSSFTRSLTLGENPAEELSTSFPALVARDFVDRMGQMLRPESTPYVEMYVEGIKDHESLAWMQWASGVQHRAKMHRPAQFSGTMKESDRDVSIFGNAVMTVRAMPDRSGLMYRPHHLRDVVWIDGLDGLPKAVWRKWCPPLHELVELFGIERLSPRLRRQWTQPGGRFEEVECMHMVVPADMYTTKKVRTPFVSLYVELADAHEIEVMPARSSEYVISRWRRISGTQYGISPAVECAHPDAKLLEAMVLTMLKVSEKAADPPVMAIEDVVREDLNLYAGGVTWIAREYDGRHQALQPIQVDKSGLQIGLPMKQMTEQQIRSAFYLDKLLLPVRDGTQTTAYEFAQRVREYVQQVSTLFDPIQDGYSMLVEDRTFAVLMDNGAFGPPDSIPSALRGADVQFRFRNPVQDAHDAIKAEQLAEAIDTVTRAATIDPDAPMLVDMTTALRDALIGKRVPVEWLRTPEAVEAAAKEQDERMQQESALQDAQIASQTVANLSRGS